MQILEGGEAINSSHSFGNIKNSFNTQHSNAWGTQKIYSKYILCHPEKQHFLSLSVAVNFLYR